MSKNGNVRRGGKKGRKIGRNVAKCAAYRASGRREARKARNVTRNNVPVDGMTAMERYARKANRKDAERAENYARLAELGIVVCFDEIDSVN